MNMADILEEGHQTNTMNRIYKILSQMNKDLSGGNSGMVALAVHQFYKNKIKANIRLALFFKDENNIHNICDLEKTLPTIYTVGNKYGSMIYTPSAMGSIRSMEVRVSSEFQDQNIGSISDIDPDRDYCVNSLIRKCTDWDTDAFTFYNYLIDNY